MRKLFSILLLFVGIDTHAQLTNTGLPMAIMPGTTVSVHSIQSAGPVNHQGLIVATGDINFTGQYAGLGSVHLTGTDQSLSIGSGVILQALTISGGGAKNLTIPITIQQQLVLEHGIVNTNDQRLLLASNAMITGGNDSAYVLSRLERDQHDSLYFPIGSNGVFTPVTLFNVSGESARVFVTHREENPQGQIGKSIVSVSDKRYWEIGTTQGTLSGARVSLPIINESLGTSINDVVVARSANGAAFNSVGADTFTGNMNRGTVSSAVLAGAGRYALAEFFNEQLLIKDSLALVTVYQSTGGSGWNRRTGWLSQNVQQWSGTTWERKRIKSLQLAENNLRGKYPAIATGLEEMESLNLANNELTDMQPPLSSPLLASLDISQNRLQFGTLETLLSGAYNLNYANQKEVLTTLRTLRQTGTTYQVNRAVTGSNNIYSWFRNGETYEASGAAFDFTIDDFEDEGDFFARVENPNVPGLTLQTRPVIVRVSSLRRDSIALRTIFQETDGQNWLRGSNSLNQSLAQWSWVTISNNRVTGIDINTVSARGEMPDDIVDIGGLTTVNLANNNLSRLPDMSTLENLTSLNVSNNRLGFDMLEPNVDIMGINYSNQKSFGEDLYVQQDVGTSYELVFDVPGSANQYRWVRNNQTPFITTDTPELTINDLRFENMGRYVLEATSDLVPDLTLSSRPQTVLAQADIRFTPIYENIDREAAVLDEGEAWLFKINEPGKPYDTTGLELIGANGIFFENIVLDNYLMFVRTDTLLLRTVGDRQDSIKLLPTYFASTIDWAEADTLYLRDFIDDSLFMQQQPRLLTDADGDGIVNLAVESDFRDDDNEGSRIENRRRVRKAGCSLRRRTTGAGRPEEDVYVLIAYKETDDNGEVSFGFLPSGFYKLNIQYPGIPMDPNSFIEFEISEDEENAGFELAATVTEDGIFVEVVEKLGFYRKYFKDLRVYPVPADDVVNIEYGRLNSDSVRVRVMDLQGRTVHTEDLQKGQNRRLQLDVRDLTGGIYLLDFYDEENTSRDISRVKLIIRHP